MKRKKPEGQDLKEWCSQWDLATHLEKIEACNEHGISYDTGKHWRSEEAQIPKSKLEVSLEPVDEEAEAIREVLALSPVTKLDFVTFDIETTNLKADFSIVLSAVIKPFGGEPVVFRADEFPEWSTDRADDSEIVAAITKELSQHAVIITHYGTKFDIPYIRAKMIRYGLPPLPPMFHVDTYAIAKIAMCVSSRRLAALSRYLRLGGKSEVEGGLWMEAAMNGTKKAIDSIVAHNIQDCIILEKLAAITFPYLRSVKRL